VNLVSTRDWEKIGGKEAVHMKIADAACSEADLWNETMKMAQVLAEKDRKTYATIKSFMRPAVVSHYEKAKESYS